MRNQTGKYLFPIHRLDRPVSGVILFALSSEIARKIKDNWHSEDTIKKYVTLARGHMDNPGSFDFSLKDKSSGILKEALTLFWPLHHFEDTTLYKVQIKTGRHHQIRRHFSRRCMNIIGDTTHGKSTVNHHFMEHYNLHRIFLHASELQIKHPVSNKLLKIQCPLPDELSKTLDMMGTVCIPIFRDDL